MHYISGWFAAIAVALVVSAVADTALPVAFGHDGIIEGENAPPVNFENMEVTVYTYITPYPLEAGGEDTVNLKIRFLDRLTGDTFEEVVYRIDIWKAEQLLARSIFYDSDGVLYIEVRPDGNCDTAKPWMCTSYEGSEHPTAPGALYVAGGTECNDGNIDVCSRPAITGPIFDRGGLYNIKIEILSAADLRIPISERLSFDRFVSVAQKHDFLIRTAHAEEVPVVIKTYYEDVGNFAFDLSDSSISFDMQFDWNPDYIDSVRLVRQEVRVPDSFAPFAPENSFTGYVNGVELDQRGLISDPYSVDGTNILHFLITDKTLKKISDALGPDNHANKVMNLKVVPSPETKVVSSDFYLVDLEDLERQVPTGVSVSYEGTTHGAGQDIPFEFAFFDEDRVPIQDVRYAYAVFDELHQELARGGYDDDDTATPGIVSLGGSDVQTIHIPSEGPIIIDVLVYGAGPDYTQKHAGVGTAILDIGSGATTLIPSWIKDNAGWWADNTIDDATFIQSIQFLVQNGVIKMSETGISSTGQESRSESGTVPSWVKISAGWWADNIIDDVTFIQSIQFLIRQGILTVHR